MTNQFNKKIDEALLPLQGMFKAGSDSVFKTKGVNENINTGIDTNVKPVSAEVDDSLQVQNPIPRLPQGNVVNNFIDSNLKVENVTEGFQLPKELMELTDMFDLPRPQNLFETQDSVKQISSLLGRSFNSIRNRRNQISQDLEALPDSKLKVGAMNNFNRLFPKEKSFEELFNFKARVDDNNN